VRGVGAFFSSETKSLTAFERTIYVVFVITLGPFLGAVIVMNPRHSMRKVLGLDERALNPCLERILLLVDRVRRTQRLTARFNGAGLLSEIKRTNLAIGQIFVNLRILALAKSEPMVRLVLDDWR
jgi:hypothetical protein